MICGHCGVTIKKTEPAKACHVHARDVGPHGVCAACVAAPLDGKRARFTAEFSLGASTRDQLTRVVEETFAAGDEGVLVFPHANQKGCPGWWFVEVDSRRAPGLKLYVGVSPLMFEVV